MVWNCAAELKSSTLDPNLLPEVDLHSSEWHNALHRWLLAAACHRTPVMHVDIHGKITDETLLDVGVRALEHIWPPRHQQFVSAFKCRLVKNMEEVLMQCQVKGPRGNLITVQCDPPLDGFRSDGFATMSMQAAMLGVPSAQLEFPPMLRMRSMNDTDLCQRLAAGIADVYFKIVVPWHSEVPGQSVEALSSEVATTPESDEDYDVFAMLSQMVDDIAVDEHTGETNTTKPQEAWTGKTETHSDVAENLVEAEGLKFPTMCVCEEYAKGVSEIEGIDDADFEDWSMDLLQAFLRWDQSEGCGCRSI